MWVVSRVVMWKCSSVYPGVKCPPTMLMVDMLAAVPAKRFFGSPLSTFSANIVQVGVLLWPHCGRAVIVAFP